MTMRGAATVGGSGVITCAMTDSCTATAIRRTVRSSVDTVGRRISRGMAARKGLAWSCTHCAIAWAECHIVLLPQLVVQLPSYRKGRVTTITVQQLVAAIRASGRYDNWIGASEAKYGLSRK